MNGGSEIKDKVRYSIPMGYLGQLIHKIWIKKYLEKIFEYRKKVIEKLLTLEKFNIILMNKILATAFLALSFYATNAQEINIVEYDLENGLHIILHQDNSAPVISTVLQYHVGSKDEDQGIKGFAHLFEHMLHDLK